MPGKGEPESGIGPMTERGMAWARLAAQADGGFGSAVKAGK